MKKKTKQMLLLAVVLVLLVLAYMIFSKVQKNNEQKQREQDIIDSINSMDSGQRVMDFTTAAIVGYEYTNEYGTMGFFVDGENYINQMDEAFPVNAAYVKYQLAAIGDLTYSKKIENDDGTEVDKAEYGLDTPKITCRVQLTNGMLRSFALGDENPITGDYYFLDVDNNSVYLVDNTFFNEFYVKPNALIAQEEMSSLSTNQIESITVESGLYPDITLKYAAEEELPWKLTTESGTYGCDSDAVLDKLSVFGAYSLRTTYEYACRNFAKYGLETPLARVTVSYLETDPDGFLTNQKNTLVFEFGDDNEEGLYYVRVNGSPYVYGISKTYMEKLASFEVTALLPTVE